MITLRLAKLLEDREISQSKLCKMTKIRPGTINAYYHGFVKRLNVEDLDKICDALECNLTDLIEYIPNKKSLS